MLDKWLRMALHWWINYDSVFQLVCRGISLVCCGTPDDRQRSSGVCRNMAHWLKNTELWDRKVCMILRPTQVIVCKIKECFFVILKKFNLHWLIAFGYITWKSNSKLPLVAVYMPKLSLLFSFRATMATAPYNYSYIFKYIIIGKWVFPIIVFSQLC